MNTKNNRKYNHKQVKTVPSKKKTIDKNQLLAYLLAVLIIFWTVASVFGLIAYARTRNKSSYVISASAQSAQTWKMRDTDEPVIVNGNINELYRADFNAPQFRVDFSSVTGMITNDVQTLPGDPSSGVLTHAGEVFVSSFYIDFFDDGVAVFYNNQEISTNDTIQFLVVANTDIISPTPINYSATTYFSSDFDMLPSNIQYSYVVVDEAYFYYTTNADISFPRGRLNLWYVVGFTYYNLQDVAVNVNTFFLNIEIPAFSGEASMYLPSINQDLIPEDFYYIDNYLSEIADGEPLYGDGRYYFYTIYADYLEEQAYDEGYRVGYAVGIEDGANLNNIYTFDNLLSAVFDVPIRTFATMFDFEILGFNIANFFFGLMSVAIGLALIRIIF